MGLGRRPHSPALPHPGKMALARGPEPVERNRLSAPPLLAGHLDLGNASHRGSEAGALVLVERGIERPIPAPQPLIHDGTHFPGPGVRREAAALIANFV